MSHTDGERIDTVKILRVHTIYIDEKSLQPRKDSLSMLLEDPNFHVQIYFVFLTYLLNSPILHRVYVARSCSAVVFVHLKYVVQSGEPSEHAWCNIHGARDYQHISSFCISIS